ncbi:MAG: hypothetical protein WBV82_18870 [Myxococcaceae bacterium]
MTRRLELAQRHAPGEADALAPGTAQQIDDFDFNVAPHHLERFRDWSTHASKTNAEFVLLPGVTHAFVTLESGGTKLDLNFSPAALDEIITWHRGL